MGFLNFSRRSRAAKSNYSCELVVISLALAVRQPSTYLKSFTVSCPKSQNLGGPKGALGNKVQACPSSLVVNFLAVS